MQKRIYQEFRDERDTEMVNYPNSIPVGQPIHPNAYQQSIPQQYASQQQYQPQPPIQMPPPNIYPPQSPYQIPQIAPPQM
jgi:hypothetical protein